MSEADSMQEKITGLFDLVAGGYDNPSLRHFAFCADYMVNRLRPRPGSKVLDVATGTGVVAVAAGQVVGPSGRVHAIDLSENMMAKAQMNVDKMALANVDFHTMDAGALEFKSRYFDYVLCSFGVFFLEDMEKAVRDWVRVLKPGGKLMYSVFTRDAFQPMANLFRDRLLSYGVEVDEAAWYRLAEASDCGQLLEQAGARDIELEERQFGFHLNDVDAWWAMVWNSGFRGYLEQVPAEKREQFQREHLEEVAALATDKGIWMDVGVRLVSGARANA